MTSSTHPNFTAGTPRSLGDSVVQVTADERQRVADALRIGRISFLTGDPMH
jgi:hypothetical protein